MALSFFISCERLHENFRERHIEHKRSVDENNHNFIKYYNDTRTGLCFAIIIVDTGGGTDGYARRSISITSVPCEKIQKELFLNSDVGL